MVGQNHGIPPLGDGHVRRPSVSLSTCITLIIFAALCLSASLAHAKNDDKYLECRYSGFKSLYSAPKIFTITRDGYAHDGDNKMKLNLERILDSYLFGSATKNNNALMHSIDIFNGNWSQYTITKDEIMKIRNIEDVTKSKINSYAGLDWKHVGECKGIDK